MICDKLTIYTHQSKKAITVKDKRPSKHHAKRTYPPDAAATRVYKIVQDTVPPTTIPGLTQRPTRMCEDQPAAQPSRYFEQPSSISPRICYESSPSRTQGPEFASLGPCISLWLGRLSSSKLKSEKQSYSSSSIRSGGCEVSMSKEGLFVASS